MVLKGLFLGLFWPNEKILFYNEKSVYFIMWFSENNLRTIVQYY